MLADNGWALDIDDLNAQVSDKTRVIAICNPNNPTGYILTDDEMDAIVAAADSVGAWILADEVYRGAERLREEETSSFFGRYDKVLALGSMSKAYGLPGLRVGWVVGPPDTIEDIWRRHEYTTITASMLSNLLATYALSGDVRPRLLQRTRDYIRKGFPVHLDINSTELMEKLCRDASVFVGAGDSFGMDHHIRIAFGQDKSVLDEAFSRIEKTLQTLAG
jgi:aspartate/methionine/tyrosine aminotransferase